MWIALCFSWQPGSAEHLLGELILNYPSCKMGLMSPVGDQTMALCINLFLPFPFEYEDMVNTTQLWYAESGSRPTQPDF
jgi:hypothetical protein